MKVTYKKYTSWSERRDFSFISILPINKNNTKMHSSSLYWLIFLKSWTQAHWQSIKSSFSIQSWIKSSLTFSDLYLWLHQSPISLILTSIKINSLTFCLLFSQSISVLMISA
jgi:hypothetical protein